MIFFVNEDKNSELVNQKHLENIKNNNEKSELTKKSYNKRSI